MRSDDAHRADPVGRNLRNQRVQDLQAGGVHHKNLWIVAVTKQTSLLLSANGKLIELRGGKGGGLGLMNGESMTELKKQLKGS